MAEITLPAATGRTTGSAPSRRLRADGRVPATVYGLGSDAVSVSVDWRELRGALTTDAGVNALINLEVDGHASELTIVKDLQRHPIRTSARQPRTSVCRHNAMAFRSIAARNMILHMVGVMTVAGTALSIVDPDE